MSMFRDMIGNSLESRVMEYFTEWKSVEITPKDLVDAKCCKKISQADEMINFLFENKFIRVKGKGFTLNLRNGVAKKYSELFNEIIKQEIKQELPKLARRLKVK